MDDEERQEIYRVVREWSYAKIKKLVRGMHGTGMPLAEAVEKIQIAIICMFEKRKSESPEHSESVLTQEHLECMEVASLELVREIGEEIARQL